MGGGGGGNWKGREGSPRWPAWYMALEGGGGGGRPGPARVDGLRISGPTRGGGGVGVLAVLARGRELGDTERRPGEKGEEGPIEAKLEEVKGV